MPDRTSIAYIWSGWRFSCSWRLCAIWYVAYYSNDYKGGLGAAPRTGSWSWSFLL